MGFREGLAERTNDPSDFGIAVAAVLMDMVEHLAAGILVFGGARRNGGYADKSHPHPFHDFFEMEQAGFEPFTKDIAVLSVPTLKEAAAVADAEIIPRALRSTIAFLCVLSQGEARGLMRSENWKKFSEGLCTSVAERCAGRYGFHPEPQETWATIRALLSTFSRGRILNENESGHNDGLGMLLFHLAASEDGCTEYGFVTGSRNQPLGCAAHLVKVMVWIHDMIGLCAKDVKDRGW